MRKGEVRQIRQRYDKRRTLLRVCEADRGKKGKKG